MISCTDVKALSSEIFKNYFHGVNNQFSLLFVYTKYQVSKKWRYRGKVEDSEAKSKKN